MSKPYRTNVNFAFGLVNIYVDLVGVKVPGASESLFRNACPTCIDVTLVQQQLVCPNGHGPFAEAQLDKARKIDKDAYVKLTKEEMDQIKASFPVREMQIQVCPAEEFSGKTLPGTTAYRLRPNPKTPGSSGSYLLLKEVVSDATKVFYGMLKMDASAAPKPYRLEVWNDQVIIQSLIPPSLIDECDKIDGTVNTKHVAAAKALVKKMVAPFDGASLTDGRRERADAIASAKRGVSAVAAVTAPVQPVTQKDDLLALLEASLEG